MLRTPAAFLFATVAAFTLLLGAGAAPLAAQSVPKLTSQLVDEARVVGGRQADVERSLADLLDAANVQLYVAFIPTTGGAEPDAFAQATFEDNALGGNDLVLIVAVDDHRYAWWDNGAVPSLSSPEIDSMLSQTLEPRFRAGDYPGGVIDFASALRTRLVGGSGPTAAPEGGGSTSSPNFDLGALGAVLGVVLLLAGAVVLWSWWRRSRQARLSVEERDRRTGQLARDANASLIGADDAIRDATAELGFAEAQFDEPDVQPFRAALASAQDELKAAFTIRQALDDATPEDPETREKMLGEILARSQRITQLLDGERRRIQALREEEQTAPKLLAGLPARIDALATRLPTAEARLADVQRYAPASWASVDGNVEESRKRLDAATAELAVGHAALQATPPDARAAARSARRVERALAEATTLVDAIDRLATSLDEARTRLDPEVGAAAVDLQSARAALAGHAGDVVTEPAAATGLAARLEEADALLARAREQIDAPAPDVLQGVQDAQRANAIADEVLAKVREAAAQQAREAAALASALRTAEARIAQAADYIETRRAGVGREARTRMGEAQRHLEQARALAATDAAAATREAAIAERLAAEAYQLARADFDDWDTRGGRGGESDLGKLILGGIVLGNILGGMGRRGGGWGGTPWGIPGPIGGGRGGGGGWSPGGGGGGRGGRGSW